MEQWISGCRVLLGRPGFSLTTATSWTTTPSGFPGVRLSVDLLEFPVLGQHSNGLQKPFKHNIVDEIFSLSLQSL